MKKAFEPAFDARRTAVATTLVAIFLFGLVVRLYYLQVVKGDEYVEKSQSNFISEHRIAHSRGLILDQAGRVLVDNRPSHDVYITVAFLPDSTKTLRQLLAPAHPEKAVINDADQRVLAAVETDGDDEVVLLDGVPEDACKDIEAVAAQEDIRGVVVDRGIDGTCQVSAHARDFPSRASVFRHTRELVGLNPDDMKERVESALRKSHGLGRFKPAVLLEDIGFDAYARLEAAASLGDLPGVEVVDSQKRRYREKTLASHVLGYMNEINSSELEEREGQGYHLGDLVGRRGVEAAFEDELRGKDGIRPVVVDAKGRNMGDAFAEELLGPDRNTPAIPGHTLVLSLDEDMQRTAEAMFGGVKGSVVALDVNTGFVLAMASFPPYDPNLVSGPWSKKYIHKLSRDPLKPWSNKAIQDHYAPGSTFKAITASAGLRNKVIDEHQIRVCPGFFRLGRSVWRCFNRGGHGHIALVKALQYSCDTYFYSVGYDLGPDRLAETARLFGFGSRTDIGIDRETPGLIPDRKYYVRRFGAYTPGLVVNNAIGQGDVAVTPLQLAIAYATIANGGTVYKPQLVREIRDADGNVIKTIEPVVRSHLDMLPSDLALVKEALSHVTEPGGTASGLLWRHDQYKDMSEWLRNANIKIVGKTGTAQVVRLSKSVQHIGEMSLPYEQRDHAWFVGFAPKEHPEVVVVTMTEHGGFGGSTSAPVTAEVLKTWFTQVRGTGRYADLPPLPPPKNAPRPPPPKKVEPPDEDETPPTAVEPETDPKAPPDAPNVMPTTPPRPDPKAEPPVEQGPPEEPQ